jgi:amino acid transporter
MQNSQSPRSLGSRFDFPPPELRKGALRFPSILMQGITHIAPAAALLFTIQFITSFAGITSPLAYAIAFVIVLMLGISLTQLAKHFPSAGGYYAYVSRTIHPRAGFLVAWLYFLYDPATTGVNLALMGYLFESTLKAQLGLAVPWWVFFLPATLLITILTYRGIEVSSITMTWLALAEIAIVVALALSGLLHPGNGGINFYSYVPGNAPSRSSLYLGVVFSIFVFAGFESVAPLAEESEDPRRTLPRAIIFSILLMGAFFVFCSWAVLVGWGTQNLKSFIDSSETPSVVLAKHLWGRFWILIFIALLNSILAASIACTNAATRVFFAMGRNGSLPRGLARVHIGSFQCSVNSTPTRFRHIFLMCRMLQKNEAAKGSNKRSLARFLRRFKWRHGR